MTWISAAVTHPGLKRKTNEDSFLDKPERGLWAVADGMGGGRCGEEASRAIVNALEALENPRSRPEHIEQSLQHVNYSLYHQSVTTPPYGPMGSTVALLLTRNDQCRILWAGDSRVYRYRNKSLKKLSKDHSYVQQLIEQGSISEEEARKHPQAHHITKAIGVDVSIDIDSLQVSAKPGDRYLLCSDGLYNELSENEIAEQLNQLSIKVATDNLLNQVLSRTASDNITIIIVEFK